MRTALAQGIKLILSFALFQSTLAFAELDAEHSLEIRKIERTGENHVRFFLSAFERDGDTKFPITTLDRNSFLLSAEGKIIPSPNFSLTTFSSGRKWNTRAVVWIYDASGVKSIKNLTRELRMLAAQEFPQLQSDYLSITGVASDKNFERVLLDPQNQENITVLQRQLTTDSVSLKSSAVSREPALCHAARRFMDWQRRGLQPADQKTLIIMGGSALLAVADRKKAGECAEILKQSGVVVHQIVFSRPEFYGERQWMSAAGSTTNGSTFRVVNLGGASRALQTIRAAIDSEYILSAQLPADIFPNSKELTLLAKYHGTVFRSKAFKPPASANAPLKHNSSSHGGMESAGLHPSPQTSPSPPQRMTALSVSSALAFDAWLEWLATALLVGVIVTFRHIQRLNGGVFEIPEGEARGDVSSGPLLIILNGRDKGREYRIRQQKTTLGKGWNCDVRLQPLRVKRRHGEIEIQGDKAILRDFSEGDLFVNGRAVRSLRVIGHGSVIRLGSLQLLFQCGET